MRASVYNRACVVLAVLTWKLVSRSGCLDHGVRQRQVHARAVVERVIGGVVSRNHDKARPAAGYGWQAVQEGHPLAHELNRLLAVRHSNVQFAVSMLAALLKLITSV